MHNPRTPPKPAKGTASLAKGIMVLNAVGDGERPMRFSEIAKEVGIPKGTTHRLLSALVSHQLLRLDPRSQTYHLGIRLFELAHKVWADFDIRGGAEPELIRLCAETGQTTRLAVLDGTDAVCIEQKNASTAIALRNAVGNRSPIYTTGAGKAILAFLEPAQQAEILKNLVLEAHTANTLTDPAQLKAELDLTKARGYAINDEEWTLGIRSVGAPILDARGRPLAALGIIGPAERLDLERLHILGRDLIEACRRVSGNVGESAVTLDTRPKPLGPDRPDVSCVLPASAFLGEGPYWSVREQALYWVDILAPAVHRLDVSNGENQTVKLPELIGAVADRQSGGLVAATQFGFSALDMATGTLTPLADPEAHLTENRFNDAKCDRKGRFWGGTLSLHAGTGVGSLYCLDTDGSVRQADTGFGVSNGIGWSPDNRTMYFTDSKVREIYAYDFDLESGAVANRRTLITLEEGVGNPDGLTVDSEGFIWVAVWDGWCVIRYDPDGQVERVINLPVPRPTSCVFGGANLDILYVTSARIRLSAQSLAEAPLSGSVFAIDAGMRGLPEPTYRG